VITIALLLGAFIVFMVQRVVAARERPVKGGNEELVGDHGEVRGRLAPEGQIFIHGALWRAVATDPNASFSTGDRVRVESVEGLTLRVTGPEAGASEANDEGAT